MKQLLIGLTVLASISTYGANEVPQLTPYTLENTAIGRGDLVWVQDKLCSGGETKSEYVETILSGGIYEFDKDTKSIQKLIATAVLFLAGDNSKVSLRNHFSLISYLEAVKLVDSNVGRLQQSDLMVVTDSLCKDLIRHFNNPGEPLKDFFGLGAVSEVYEQYFSNIEKASGLLGKLNFAYCTGDKMISESESLSYSLQLRLNHSLRDTVLSLNRLVYKSGNVNEGQIKTLRDNVQSYMNALNNEPRNVLNTLCKNLNI
jgi:hypothetical protein